MKRSDRFLLAILIWVEKELAAISLDKSQIKKGAFKNIQSALTTWVGTLVHYARIQRGITRSRMWLPLFLEMTRITLDGGCVGPNLVSRIGSVSHN